MKKALVLTLLLVLTVAVSAIAAAQSVIPDGPFSSAFRVQNLGNAAADCVVDFYDASGSVQSAAQVTENNIAPDDSLYVFTPDISNLSAGQYSAVVSCTEEAAAVVNFSDADSGASYNGISSSDVAAEWFAPSVYNNYFNFYSEVVVQNADPSSTVDVTLEVFAPGSATPVSTQTINNLAPYAAAVFDQASDGDLDAGVAYSAKITSSGGNVAAIVNIYGLGPADDQLYSYNPFAGGSTTVYAPVIMNDYFENNTALTVQNIDSNAANVTVTYGNGEMQSATIPSNSSFVFLNFVDTPLDPGTLTGATITSNNGQSIVATVNTSNPFNRAATYSGFASGSNEISAPIVLKNYFTFGSSVTCQNVSPNGNTTITINYDNGASSTSPSVAAGESYSFFQPGEGGLPDNYIGSATVEANNANRDIVCVVNQDIVQGGGVTATQDQLYSYNGINK